MELNNNNIVVLRNGQRGLVTSFQDKPFTIAFANYSNPISKYKDFKQKNTAYDIIAIYNGTDLENPTMAYKKTFSLEHLQLIWKEETK